MEHLENDMDDLFQKAGELYPLKTTGSDWDAVAGKLQNETPGESTTCPDLPLFVHAINEIGCCLFYSFRLDLVSLIIPDINTGQK